MIKMTEAQKRSFAIQVSLMPRKEAAKFRKEIAEKFGVSQRTLRRIIQLDREAKANTTAKLAAKWNGCKPAHVQISAKPVVEDVGAKSQPWFAPAGYTRGVIDAERVKRVPTYANARWMGNKKQLSVFTNDEVFTITSDNARFAEVLLLLKDNRFSDAIAIMNVKKAVELYVEGEIMIKGNSLSYKGMHIDNAMTKRLITSMQDGKPFLPLLNFFRKLMDNPDQNVVDQLYGFMLHNDIEILENGNFIAWKRVTSDFKDMYTRKIDNTIGQTVSMPREDVVVDPTRTCAPGLHVCAKSYLGHYGGGSGQIIATEVNPMNVVAVPIDYDNAKMRVCEYISRSEETKTFALNGEY